MSTRRFGILTSDQISSYEQRGYVHSIPVLTSEEIQYYRDQLEKTWVALGGRVTRADGLHLFFRWAWELATNQQLLDCMEGLLGPNIILKHTRIFYKYAKSAAWVGWHQDGFTERQTDNHVPAIWLGLTEATVENGCLRVVPRSHHLGIIAHYSRRAQDNLASSSTGTGEGTPIAADENELSVKLVRLPEGLDPPHDVVMRAGEMSFHHPLALHGSNPNLSDEPRIGLSATYSTPEFHRSSAAVALVRGNVGMHHSFELSRKPAYCALDEAATAYRDCGRQILLRARLNAFMTSEVWYAAIRCPLRTDLKKERLVSHRTLSVVIPTWNRARLVCEAVESALSQTGATVEVIVVDDGSTDGTSDLVERTFGRGVKLLRMPGRSGVGAARNAGVRHATGDLLAFLDSDDLWLPGKLNAELTVLERFPEAEAIVSDSRFSFDGSFAAASRFEQNGALAATKGQAAWVADSPWLWTVSHYGLSICAITLCRQAVTKLGQPLFAVDLISCEDWELEVRLHQECRVVALPEVWSHIRCIDDGTRIGRACPGKDRSREQDIGLLRDRLTVMARSIHPDRLTPSLAAAMEDYRSRNAQELARLEAIQT